MIYYAIRSLNFPCFQKASNRIKSYKFLPLMYQLAARMSCGSGSADMFLSTLEHVIERTVRDHPHHCLSVILALAHAHKDEEFLTSSRRGGKLSKSGKDTVQDQVGRGTHLCIRRDASPN